MTADGEGADVGFVVLSTETESEAGDGVEFEVERRVVLSYPQAESLIHDPIVGIAQVPFLPPPPPPTNGGGQEPPVAGFQRLAYFLAVGLAALFVMATLLVRRIRQP